ncbi:hypothetical protein [Spirochaeta isovalerica]|uniref:Uncharacterized protein n=1 Tax=Spirochaeta isovalerica TaxID=150 RepID=A0A841RD68_9SPIO|nr:hypothetical protein [Spirochaeta isovalerica]MBB6480799.1 hypothetical protein [Spirochaeta isovalerica]
MKKARFIIIFFILPLLSLAARGSLDRDREYFQELETTCESLFSDLEKGDLAPEEGKSVLAELRDRFGRPFTDTDGILESLIDRIAESRLSASEALYEFSLLKEGKLMTYRQEQKASGSPGDFQGSLSQDGNPPSVPQSNQPSDPPSDQSSNRGNPNKGGG